jgi:hypothetical protein
MRRFSFFEIFVFRCILPNFNFAGHLSSELSTSSLTDARRIKPGGGSITLYQSPGKLFNFGLFY